MKLALNKEETLNKFFYTMIGLVIFFTTSDLICGFSGLSVWAAVCSVISAALVFFGYFKVKRAQTEVYVKEISTFIKGNFDKWQLIFSILDVLCSVVVVFTSIMAFGLFFRGVILCKILLTPVRVITISNKFKTVTKPLLIFAFMWVFLRLKNKIKERKMENIKLSKTQKIFIIVAFVLGVAYAIVSTTCLPQIAVSDDILVQIATTLGIEGGLIFGAFLKGKVMTTEEIKKRDDKIEAKETAKVEKLEAKAKAKAEKQAEKDKEKALALAAAVEAEKKAKEQEEAEKARLLALAAKIKAEEEAKAAQEAQNNQ